MTNKEQVRQNLYAMLMSGELPEPKPIPTSFPNMARYAAENINSQFQIGHTIRRKVWRANYQNE